MFDIALCIPVDPGLGLFDIIPPHWYWYHGCLRTQRKFWLVWSDRILMLAPSAARTVSLTDCIRFWALPTSISVASWSSSEPNLQRQICDL